MNIVPMDTMSGGRADLIGRDITIRITIETLGSGPYNMGSITLLGAEVQTVLMLTTPDTNLGPGSSLHCPVWYTGISTGMTLLGRYEAEGRSGTTSTAGAGRRTRRSPGRSPRSAWPARPPGPPAPPAAAAPGADLPAATPSAAAAVPAATAVTPAAARATSPRHARCSRQPSPHPRPSCSHRWRRMSPGRVLGSRFKIFQCAQQIQALKMDFSTNSRSTGR